MVTQTVLSTLSRRKVLRYAGASALAGFPAIHALASFQPGDPSLTSGGDGFWERDRWVWLKRPATGEEIKIVFWSGGQLIQDAYEQISWFMRDVRFQRMLATKDPIIKQSLNRGVITQAHLSPWVLMDPALLDVLYAYCAWLAHAGVSGPVILTSAFRHLITNYMTEGAARDSWHMKGGAADIVVSGVKPDALARFGRWLSGGGVGLYPTKGFIHLDRGRIRSWSG